MPDPSNPVRRGAPWPRSWAHLANAAILAALWIGSVAMHDTLPDRIPMHFGFDGTPGHWVDRTWTAWMTLPIIAMLLTGLTYGAAWIVGRNPLSVNLPDKKRYDALPLDAKYLVLQVIQRFVFWITVGLCTVMASAQAGSWLVATGRMATLPWWSLAPIFALLLSSPISTVVIVLRTSTLITRLSKHPS